MKDGKFHFDVVNALLGFVVGAVFVAVIGRL